MLHLGKKLKELRQERGLTQRELAAAITAPRGVISNWELGLQPTPEKYVEALAIALKTPAGYLRGSGPLYCPQPIPIPRALRRGALRPLVQPPYPIQGNVEQMLALSGDARDVYEQARRLHPPEMLRAMDDGWFRDAVHELLGAFHLLGMGARLHRGSLSQMACPLLSIDGPQTWRNAGDCARDALVLKHGRGLLVAFPQVWLPLPRSPRCCRVDLLVLYSEGGRHVWLDVEFDGGHHADYHHADTERAAALGLPRLGYPNLRVRQAGLGALILDDARIALGRKAA